MKTLIAIVNCHSRQEYADAIRSTWLPLVQEADAFFFRGRGATRVPLPDEVWLDCGDGYESLPEKVKAICQWALERGYDFVFKLDDDVVILPRKFLATGYEAYDFVGHRNSSKEDPVPPYGFCYGLSKKAMQIVSVAELPITNYDEGWVRTQLFKHSIVLHHDPRYFLYFGKREDFISPRRPLRFHRENTVMQVQPIEGTVAWCMYLAWVGYKNLPTARVVQEFHKVWNSVKDKN